MTIFPVVSNPRAPHLTVLIGDAQMLVRIGIRTLVQERVESASFVEAEDGDELVRAAGMVAGVRLAIVDLTMPGMRGGHVLAEIANGHSEIAIIVISPLNSAEVAQRIMRIPSVCAFVPRNCNPDVMLAAIDAALKLRKLPYTPSAAPVYSAASLTPRQRQIRELLREGMSNKMIAARLGISEGTVKNHITALFRSLNATNRTQAAQREVGSP